MNRRVAGIVPVLFLALFFLATAAGCALPGGHPSANSLRKTAIEWIEAAPCKGAVKESVNDSWIIGDHGELIQWRSAGPWEWTYEQEEEAFYVSDPLDEASSPIVITKDWLETEGAYEQVAQIVGALAESLATNPYAVLRAGEVINPLVFESQDRREWYCGAEAELADVLRPYFPREVVQNLLADEPDRRLHVTYTISKEGRVLETTQVSESSRAPQTQIVCTWVRLSPAPTGK